MFIAFMSRSVVGFGAYAMLAHPNAAAQTLAADVNASDGELQTLIRAQKRRIDMLEARLRLLEAQQAPRPAPSPLVATQPVVVVDDASQPSRRPQYRIVQRTVDSEAAPPPAIRNSEKAGVVFVNGLPRINSTDGHWWFRPRGRLFLDASTTRGAEPRRNISGTSLGSARLGMEGAVGAMSWALEGEFAENRVVWKSAFANIRHKLGGAEGDLSIGNRFNDRTMDGSVGIGTTPFTDFNTVAATVLPRRGYWGVGVQERVYGANWHASVQLTGEDPNNIGDGDDGTTLVSRVHWSPVRSEALTVHLGGWGFHERLGDDRRSIVRPGLVAGGFNSLVVASPGKVTGVSSDTGYGAELALFSGRFWTQNEWGRRLLHRVGRDYSHEAFALSAGWFVFGASPPYDSRRGTWARARIDNPVTSGGTGAFALRARYQQVDYRHLPLGGVGRSATIGATWYINKITRVLIDATDWSIDNPDADSEDAKPVSDDGQTVNLSFQLQF